MDEGTFVVVGIGVIGVLVVLIGLMVFMLGRPRKEDSHTSVPYRVATTILGGIGTVFIVMIILRSPMRNQFIMLALLIFAVSGAIEAAQQRHAKKARQNASGKANIVEQEKEQEKGT